MGTPLWTYLILCGEAALAGHIDNEQHLASVLCEIEVLAINILSDPKTYGDKLLTDVQALEKGRTQQPSRARARSHLHGIAVKACLVFLWSSDAKECKRGV